MNKPPKMHRGNWTQAFSLIELLAAITIIAIIASFITGAIGPISQSMNLANGANRVTDELDFARQTAIARNQTVEIRFYQNSQDNQYDSIVCVIQANPNVANSKTIWIEKPNHLPNGVIIDTGNPSFSPILTATAGRSPKVGTADSSAPPAMRNEAYVAFHFRPNGTTDLDGDAWAGAWCLTLRNATSPSGKDGDPAANFITILIDPFLGCARTFQPQ